MLFWMLFYVCQWVSLNNSESRKFTLAVMSQYQYPFFKSSVLMRGHFGSAVITVCNKPTCYH